MKVIGRALALAGLAASLMTSGVFAADAEQAQSHGQQRGAAAAEDSRPNENSGSKSASATDECVLVHVAGRSGQIQVRGGGVHLVVRAAEADDREASDLQSLADRVADAACGDKASATELADAASAADKLDGMDVVHQNTYAAED
jgi:hypothetical protein